MDINGKYQNTKSQFIYKSGLLSAYVANRIDGCQNIKRYLCYHTVNPLGSKGLELDNDIIEQPNIDESLLDKNIFDSMFNEYMAELHENQIYVHTFRGRTNDDWGEIYIEINVLVPLTFERLANFGEKRSFAIASEIEDLFQNISVASDNADDFLIDKLGNLRFKVVQFDNNRLSKTNNIVVNTIILKTGVSLNRLDD